MEGACATQTALVNFELTPGSGEMLRWEFARCSEVFQSLYDGNDVESFKCEDERDIQGLETSARKPVVVYDGWTEDRTS